MRGVDAAPSEDLGITTTLVFRVERSFSAKKSRSTHLEVTFLVGSTEVSTVFHCGNPCSA
jgi:hypothetical protein